MFLKQNNKPSQFSHQGRALKSTVLFSMMCLAVSASFAEENISNHSNSVSTLDTISMQAEAERKAFSGNMDLVRSENDVQAYKIIDRKTIENSGATSVDELLQRTATMSTSVANQTASGWTGASSQIDLRGLGASQTLVLVNGRRGAGTGARGASEASDQQNINGIPLAAIERIEILPSSASALYGSSALGGVINVVLRRDYVGSEVNLRYDNTFDSDAGLKTANVVTGFALEDGRTRVMLTAQKQDGNELKAKDRPFVLKKRAKQLQNNPDSIYSATNPPLGNLTNIRTADGSELIAGSGSSFAYVPKGYQGAAIDGIEPFRNTVGQYALGMGNGIGSDSGQGTLIGSKDNESFSVNINRDFTDKLNVFVEGGYERLEVESAGNYHGFGSATIKANNPTNPFGKDVIVTYSPNYEDGIALRNRNATTVTKRVATGFEYEPLPEWKIVGDYAWSNAVNKIRYQRRPTVGTNLYNADLASGKLDVIRDVTTYGIDLDQGYWTVAPNFTDQTTQEYNLRTHAPIFDWYAGKAFLAAGIGHRDWESEGRSETRVINDPNTPTTLNENKSDSIYAELSIPFISREMNLPWAKLLDVQLAARHERYKITNNGSKFDATSPTAGFRFAPNDSFMIRGSYAEGFIIPKSAQMNEAELSASVTRVTDPSNNQLVDIYTTSGGNPNLEPEKAKTINAGFVFTPEFLPDFRLSVDYFKIKKQNNITTLSAQEILNANASSGLYADRIVRDANNALETVVTTPFNALWLETSGIDTQMSYNFESDFGRLNLSAGHTWTHDFKQLETMNSPVTNRLNDPANTGPLKHRFNASAYLQADDNWGFGWAMQYYSKYRLTDATSIQLQGKDTVSSQTYHDIFAKYKLNHSRSAKFGSPELTLGIKNLFSDYEVDMSQTYVSDFTDPRLRQYYMNLKFTF